MKTFSKLKRFRTMKKNCQNGNVMRNSETGLHSYENVLISYEIDLHSYENVLSEYEIDLNPN